jgi:hypothetical protein
MQKEQKILYKGGKGFVNFHIKDFQFLGNNLLNIQVISFFDEKVFTSSLSVNYSVYPF